MKFPRYLLFNYLKMFFLIFIGAIFVFVVIDFVGNIRTWLARGMDDVFAYYFNYLPYILYLISPVVLFLSIIASVGNMAKHLELTAICGAGKSMFRALSPIFIFGLLITGASFFLSEWVLPQANHKRLEIMETTQQQRQNKRVKEKYNFAFIDGEAASWFFRYYSGVTKSGRDVSIFIREKGKLIRRFDSKRIHWDSTANDSSWILERGVLRDFHSDGNISTEKFSKYPLQKEALARPEDFIDERQTGDEMNAAEVLNRMQVLRRSGEDTRALETAYHGKFANPWTNFIVLLIGAALCHRFNRSGGLSQKFGIGIFVVFSYYIVIRLALKMGENGAVSPWLGAYGPHLLFGFIAGVMLYRSFRV